MLSAQAWSERVIYTPPPQNIVFFPDSGYIAMLTSVSTGEQLAEQTTAVPMAIFAPPPDGFADGTYQVSVVAGGQGLSPAGTAQASFFKAPGGGHDQVVPPSQPGTGP